MKTILITGSQGFLGGYFCREFLSRGYNVVGVDNYSKYGRLKRDYDDHENFTLYEYDLAAPGASEMLAEQICDHGVEYLVAGAALIGGISLFSKYPYDILAINERITANTFDAAIRVNAPNPDNFKLLKRVMVISSSMVFEGADADFKREVEWCGNVYGACPNEYNVWPTKEGQELEFPPPASTYGFQKLATEYFAKGAWLQYQLPYTIIRPFNAVGLGEEISSLDEEVNVNNDKLRLSHVLPDLANKCLMGQDPLSILGDGSQIRCYTHGKDIARGLRLAVESPGAVNQTYNISTSRQTTVLELAKLIWEEVHGPDKPFRYVSEKPYTWDVQKRIPDVSKAREHFGFEAQIPLEESIREVVTHMRNKR